MLLLEEGDVAFNFQDGAALKRLYVTADQQRALVQGRLALVRQDAGYELVPAEVAEKLLSRNPALVLVLNRPEAREEGQADEDDPYADYKVPDDLIW